MSECATNINSNEAMIRAVVNSLGRLLLSIFKHPVQVLDLVGIFKAGNILTPDSLFNTIPGFRPLGIIDFRKLNDFLGLFTKKGNREQGTGNRERICCLFKNQIGVLSLFTVKSSLLRVPFFRKKMFFKESDTKKTASLFQSHVSKHEFFLFPVPRSLFPLNLIRANNQFRIFALFPTF